MEFLIMTLAAIYWFVYKGKILFSVLFCILPVAYYFMKKIPTVSKFITYKSVISSTLLGALFGVCVCSFVNLKESDDLKKYKTYNKELQLIINNKNARPCENIIFDFFLQNVDNL